MRLRAGEAGALSAYAKRMADGFARYWTTRLAYYALERRWPQSPFWRRRQPALGLQPNDIVALSPDAATVAATDRGPEPMVDLALLARLCATPAPAHEIVTRYLA